MARHAGIRPDGALPPDSLVKRILDADKVRPELIADAMKFIDEYADDFKALAAIERAERERGD
jgi:hypothetical protein